MNLSEKIVWDIVNEFIKNEWLNEKAELHWNNKHICIKTIRPIAKKVNERIRKTITKKVMELISKEN